MTAREKELAQARDFVSRAERKITVSLKLTVAQARMLYYALPAQNELPPYIMPGKVLAVSDAAREDWESMGYAILDALTDGTIKADDKTRLPINVFSALTKNDRTGLWTAYGLDRTDRQPNEPTGAARIPFLREG